MQNELLIAYKLTEIVEGRDGQSDEISCGEIVSYTVTNSKNEILIQAEQDCSSISNMGMFELNLATEVLMSLGLEDLNNLEIERSMSTLGTRLIWVRY
jgi:hypothetical protein